ncbi:RNA pseudouridylate synthase domain-containing protein 1 [Rhizophagus clarus]|nr:RNA pseudouridylate synthase domain-containing protein 1 [Rhizophagus clarus]
MNKREQTQRFNSNIIDVNKNNDMVKYEIPKIQILFRNEEFLIINKPYDIRIDGDTSKGHTVLSLLYNQIPNLPKPLRNVHQLDHATSGCYCLALTKKSAGIASIAFAKREVDKYYLAIVRGWMKNDSYVVEQPIAEVPNNRYRMCIGTEDNPGKSSKTEIKVLRRGYFHSSLLPPSPSTTPPPSPSEYIQVTLIRLHPITGRRHQLRLHCQFLNHPIVGDWHYERQIMNYTDTWRMMLHAQKLVIPLNKTDEALDVNAGDPFSELVTENFGYDYVEVERENK